MEEEIMRSFGVKLEEKLEEPIDIDYKDGYMEISHVPSNTKTTIVYSDVDELLDEYDEGKGFTIVGNDFVYFIDEDRWSFGGCGEAGETEVEYGF